MAFEIKIPIVDQTTEEVRILQFLHHSITQEPGAVLINAPGSFHIHFFSEV